MSGTSSPSQRDELGVPALAPGALVTGDVGLPDNGGGAGPLARERSPRFREWWDEHEVIEAQRGTKVIQHPQLGALRLHHAQTVPPGQPDLRMAVYAPAAGQCAA